MPKKADTTTGPPPAVWPPTLNQAIFSQPVGKLSERLEDQRGFHIVRVIEREDAGQVPFVDAQVDIKESIRKQKIRKQITDYVNETAQRNPGLDDLRRAGIGRAARDGQQAGDGGAIRAKAMKKRG
jgi:hypothetical protein